MLSQTEILKALTRHPKNHELYLLLGRSYLQSNVNQAWLCFENAEFFCTRKEDMEEILACKKLAKESPEWGVNPLAIVILTYNGLELTKKCIASIRRHNLPASYELIVVDNASGDGTVEWLRQQPDIMLQCNEKNLGFPVGCNQGIALASPGADIFLLNNDTQVYENTIFNLRMGLYSEDSVGAAGSVTNYCGNRQRIACDCITDEEFEAFAGWKNQVGRQRYEKLPFLIGYALLIRRETLDEVGLLDENFTPGMYEDNDICLRITRTGKQCICVHNSFIRHYGHGNGANIPIWQASASQNKAYLKEKWGFDMSSYARLRQDLVNTIRHSMEAPISVLEIDCGLGATLSRIQYVYPHAGVWGVEAHPAVAALAAHRHDILCLDVETMELPYEEESFDYILFGRGLHRFENVEAVLEKLSPYLKEEGTFICGETDKM